MPARRGSWTALSPRTRERWVSRFGGRGDRDVRERRARAAYDAGAVIRRREAGHERVGEREAKAMSAMFAGVGWAVVEAPTVGERARIARWNARAGELRVGQISGERFRRIIRTWAPLRGARFEADPERVLAVLRERDEAGEQLFEYRGRRT